MRAILPTTITYRNANGELITFPYEWIDPDNLKPILIRRYNLITKHTRVLVPRVTHRARNFAGGEKKTDGSNRS